MKSLFMISCKKASQLMSEQLEHPLPFYKRYLFKMHLSICEACSFFDRQIRGLKETFTKRANADETSSLGRKEKLSDETRQRIKSSLKE